MQRGAHEKTEKGGRHRTDKTPSGGESQRKKAEGHGHGTGPEGEGYRSGGTRDTREIQKNASGYGKGHAGGKIRGEGKLRGENVSGGNKCVGWQLDPKLSQHKIA